MRGVWTTEAVRAAEQRLMATVPEGTLMRRAAFGVAGQAARLLTEHAGGVSGRRVALLVGAGSNGGDALWAGAFLRRRGVGVTAVLLNPERTHAEGLAALRRAGGRVVEAGSAGAALTAADLVVDGIVGLSGKGPLRPGAAELVAAVTAPVLAVDMPSGVDPDTGAVDGPAVRAAATVTFGCRKPVHVLGAGAVHSGTVHVVEIGVERELPEPDMVLLDAADVGAAWPVPGAEDNKYRRGVTGVAAGSATYPGAAVLASGAAVQGGTGMVRYAGTAADAVRARWPEVVATGSVTDAGRVQAWVVGPGVGTGGAGHDVLEHVLSAGVPVCADADAITLLARDPDLWDARDPDTPVVLTPHEGEFARLAGEIGPDRVAAVRRAAERFRSIVLLKGHTTVIAHPDGRVLVNLARSAWPATAGSGDVLSGLIGSLLAAGVDPWLAAGCAAYVHDLAGDLAAEGAPIGASAMVEAVPDALRTVRAATVTG
ncbi:NAD(P)H-hydrate dehydratase [Gandjariella thermophila]|uniref:Bifunctional NAD(P)H-hydrate repair enzyme n=1 Tax=Gandjariella thermophila TaxID=1931992 RepID=A0A4D4IYI2_9PSEU|nr:NAD(P)H-hydrate dehydratase [Gandjariella thermophila]GDY29301.1 bifunctional NAD(P)H-hydrate repair enzyme [Gandjariella thermophila]